MTTWVLLAGLPGTGKSTLARVLTERLNAAILDKDKVRAALFPGRLTDYTLDQDELTMRAMEQAAAYLTQRQRVDYILFDGRTFSLRQQMDDVLLAAERVGAPWRVLHLVCADTVAEERLLRSDLDHPAKNRGPELYRSIQQRFEPIVRPSLQVDTTLGVEGQLARVERYLKGEG